MLSAKKELFTPSGGGYQISRSVRLRSSATAYFNRTPATAGDRKTWTYSCWVKRGTLGVDQALISAYTGTATINTQCSFMADNTLDFYDNNGSYVFRLTTTQVFRDPSAWYHIVLAVDTTQATSSNRVKIYVNGTQITSFSTATYPPLNDATGDWNSNTEQRIGRHATLYFDGYLAEINNIDGQALTPSSFGETNAITGVWQPKRYAGTYGTNGFYLNFSDNSGATATTIGKDYSGNGNNWTPNNISVTAGVTYDSMLDVPTLYADGGNGRGNYPTMSPLDQQSPSSGIQTNANLTVNSSSQGCNSTQAMITAQGGYWYAEATQVNNTNDNQIGINAGANALLASGTTPGRRSWRNGAGSTSWLTDDTPAGAGTPTALSSGDTLAIAVDMTNLAIYFGKIPSGSSTVTWMNGGVPTSGASKTGAIWTDLSKSPQWFFHCNGNANGVNVHMNFGQRPFQISAVPTGFKALNTQNLPTPTISNGASYMAATLYAGTSVAQSIVNTVNGVSFQPDFVWGKNRTNVNSHRLTDVNRGVGKVLFSDGTAGDTTGDGQLSSFNLNGFGLTGGTGAFEGLNQSGNNYVAWQWKAGGTAVTNTAGSITSSVSANTTAGFSVVTYTGTGANATVGHGLGVALNFIIIKDRTSGSNFWVVGGTNISFTSDNYLRLNGTGAIEAGGGVAWNSTAPTSTVFSIGTSGVLNASSNTYVAYCFAPVAGYSAFGKYTGNGSANGPFVYLGFRPRFVIIRRIDAGNNWHSYTSTIDPSNVVTKTLYPNTSGTEGTENDLDFVSNGMKMRDTGTHTNASGGTYIYMAWAENPFQNSLAR